MFANFEHLLWACLTSSFSQCVNKILFNVVYSQTICCLRRNWSFLCSVISQGKVVALDRWGGKWNHLSMTHRLTTIYDKNYWNRTLTVKVIVENVVSCFLGGHGVLVANRKVCAFDWHQDRWPWMTSNSRSLNFQRISRNFANFGRIHMCTDWTSAIAICRKAVCWWTIIIIIIIIKQENDYSDVRQLDL